MTPRGLFHRVNQAGQILLGCGLLLWAQMTAAQAITAAEREAREQMEYHILAAELAGQRGELRFAAAEYLKALELMPNAELAERATRVALYAEADELALRAALHWIAEDPDRYEARLLIVRLALRAGEDDLAHAQSTALIWQHPEGQGAAFRELARNLAGEADHGDQAQALMLRLVKEFPGEAAGYYALGLLALRQDDPVEAERAADAALALRPEWSDALLLKLTALLRQERVADADALMAKQKGDDDLLAGLHLAYARLLLETEYGEASIRQFKTALKYDDENPEALYALALLYMNSNQPDEAYDYLVELYELDTPRQDEAAYYLGGVEEARGNYKNALKWYRLAQNNGHAMDAAQRQAYVLYRLDRLDEARAMLGKLREQHPNEAIRMYLVEAELLYQARAYSDAALLYDEALESYPDEPDLLYGRSLVSERLGRITSAEKDLRRLLELDPDDARSLNALGYILSNHSRRYDEALDLISRALEQNPDDPTVIDSMGWIKYRMGDLQAALRYLNAAYAKMPDPEVAAHLGEVLWKMGQRSRAQNVWREALREDPEHPVLQETINRLTR